MPKRSINVNNFSGGLNNNTNPRDIADNEFQTLNGLDNEIPGKLRLFGSVKDFITSNPPLTYNYSETHSTFNIGNGLTYLTLDRDIDNAGTIAANELLLVNDANATNVDFYNLTGDKDTAQFSYGNTASPLNAFVVDGQIRLSATKTDDGSGGIPNNTPKWYGYINKTYNLGNLDGSLASGDGITDTEDEIAKTYNSYFVSDAYIAPLYLATDGYAYDVKDNNLLSKQTLAQTEIVLNPNLNYPSNVTAIRIDSGTPSTRAGLHGILDDNTSAIADGYGGFAAYAWFHEDSSTAGDLAYGGDSYISVYGNGSGITYALFASNVYDEQESYPVYIGDIKQPTGGVFALSTTIYKRPLFFMLAGRMPQKPRQSGINLYWALNENNSFGQKYLFAEINFEKGIRYNGESNYTGFGDFTSTRKYYIHPDNNNSDIINGKKLLSLSQNEPYLNFNQSAIGRQGSSFKTSAIANRRAYIGNVALYDGTRREVKSDTVLKSDVNKFDTFRPDNFIDVEINDGDEIIALETLNNQLLQFKRNTLYIINISRDIEFLEGTYEFRGCEKDYHVVRGEGFVSWFNQSSVFLYDGQRVIDINLNETGQPRLANWRNDYYSNDAVIGYYPDKKSIFIFNSEDNQLLQFDIKSQSWSFVDVTLANMSNIVTNNNGDMLFLQHSGSTSTLKKWDDAAFDVNLGDNGILLQTKELDFGNPDTNKNINTLYISYKQPNTERVQIRAIADSGSVIDIDTLEASSSFTTKKISMPAGFKGIKTFTLQVAQHGASAIDDEFEINDMQIIYREMVKR